MPCYFNVEETGQSMGRKHSGLLYNFTLYVMCSGVFLPALARLTIQCETRNAQRRMGPFSTNSLWVGQQMALLIKIVICLNTFTMSRHWTGIWHETQRGSQ